MKPKTMILMVVAVTCGLGASYMTSRLLAERGQEAPPETVKVLVAKVNLDMGKPLKNVQDLFEEKEYIKNTEPKNGIVKYEDLKGRMLKRPLRAGDFVTPEDLLGERESFMQHNLPKGHVALGIRVNMESIAGGWASLPLSRVNLILTVKRGSDKDSFSMTLLENVLVLAADQTAARTEGGQAMPANVVTVALTPEDAHKVTLARELGSLSLVLRQFEDHRIGAKHKLTIEEMLTQIGANKDDITEVTEVLPQPKVELPELPKVEPKALAQVEPEQPKGRKHKMKIMEGDRERFVEYWLDDNDQVIDHDVVRSELLAPVQPRPAQVAPREGKEDN